MAATLKLGSVGADVETWQGLLASAGYAVPQSGVFDEATKQQTIAWQKAKGLVPDGIVGPASWGAMTGKAAAGKADPRAQEGRDALLASWRAVTGEDPNLAELQIAGAQAHLESGYGHSNYQLLDHATGNVLAKSGTIWNWGAVQGGSSSDGTGFLATDTSPYKVTTSNPKGYYDHHYRIYPNSAAGAVDYIKQITVRRPTSWALMKVGDIDAWAEAMHARYVSPGKPKLDPISGVPGYFEQKPSERAKGIAMRIADIAFTLNEPIAAKRGGPVAPGEAVSPEGGADEAGGMSTAKKVIISGGAIAALYAIFKIWVGWPR